MAEDDILAPEVEELCKLIARIIREALTSESDDGDREGGAA